MRIRLAAALLAAVSCLAAAAEPYPPVTTPPVVMPTVNVQKAMADLDAAVRRLTEQEVVLEVRWLTVADDFCCERIGVDFSGDNGPKYLKTPNAVKWLMTAVNRPSRPIFLDDKQLAHLVETAQADERTHMTQAPRITLFNAQTGALEAKTSQNFVTRVKATTLGAGNPAFQPIIETVNTGTSIAATPVIAADRRSVRVELRYEQSEVATPVQTMSVILPIYGVDGKESPRTLLQLVQAPTVRSHVIHKTVRIADGGTMLLGGFKTTSEERIETCPPYLSSIPYLNRLFTTVGIGRVENRTFLLVTAHITCPAE